MSSEQYFEYIVVGCGGIGSGALYWLSRKAGKNVLGLEQFKLGHVNGGSQDHSRIIRMMNCEDAWTRLARQTFETWAEVEKESGLQIYHKTGGMSMSSRKSARYETLDNYKDSMDRCGVACEKLEAAEIRRRYPQIKCDDDMVAVLDPAAGLVDAALGNAAHVQLAQARGATVIDQCPVTRLEPLADGGCKVYTPQGVFRCRRVVVTSGAWINHVLGTVGVHVPVEVTQENVTYFATPNMKKFTKDKFPVFIYHDDRLDIYALPIHGNSGFKIGYDAGGHVVDANTRTFIPDPVREEGLREFLRTNIPEAVGPILETKTCLYTLTKDRSFVIDSLASKGMPQILVCCGAGHAYKWASLFGRILSELAVDGHTPCDIAAFSIERPAVTDPNFKRTFHVGYQPKQSKL